MSNKEMSKLVHAVGRMLLALGLVLSQAAWAAQSQNPKENPEPAGKTSAQQAPVNGSASTPAKAESEESKSPAKLSTAEETASGGGPHEGIKVHGHWTIEVRNPDGTLDGHVEFENSLDHGFSWPSATPLPLPGGAAYLTALMSGQAAAPGNYWAVMLVGPSGLSNLTNTANAPCLYGGWDMCLIVEQASVNYIAPCTPATPGVSCNLSASPSGTATTLSGLQLSGSVVATQSGQVSTVATLVDGVCNNITNCALSATGGFDSFTSNTNFPGSPISVSPGQTIAVTVVISFS